MKKVFFLFAILIAITSVVVGQETKKGETPRFTEAQEIELAFLKPLQQEMLKKMVACYDALTMSIEQVSCFDRLDAALSEMEVFTSSDPVVQREFVRQVRVSFLQYLTMRMMLKMILEKKSSSPPQKVTPVPSRQSTSPVRVCNGRPCLAPQKVGPTTPPPSGIRPTQP